MNNLKLKIVKFMILFLKMFVYNVMNHFLILKLQKYVKFLKKLLFVLSIILIIKLLVNLVRKITISKMEFVLKF